jgi:hypothetical protein
MPKRKKKPYESLDEQAPLRQAMELIERLRPEPRYALVAANAFIELLVSLLIKAKSPTSSRGSAPPLKCQSRKACSSS